MLRRPLFFFPGRLSFFGGDNYPYSCFYGSDFVYFQNMRQRKNARNDDELHKEDGFVVSGIVWNDKYERGAHSKY